jgi:hypothetical protein
MISKTWSKGRVRKAGKQLRSGNREAKEIARNEARRGKEPEGINEESSPAVAGRKSGR